MPHSGHSSVVRKKKRRRRRTPPLFPFVLLGLLILGALWGMRWLTNRRPILSTAALPPNYVSDNSALETEYAHYYGKAIAEPKIASRFRQAADLAAKRNYPGASTMLESLTRDAALPVVYSNLGIIYTSLGDYARATDTFREVLARDSGY